MACSAFTVTPKCPPQSSWFPSKCSSNITRSRGRISMSMANPVSNDLVVPEQKLVTPGISTERILDPFQARIKMQSGSYQMQSSTYQGERAHYRSGGSYRRRRRGKPPDIPSAIFNKGIVYIGMPGGQKSKIFVRVSEQQIKFSTILRGLSTRCVQKIFICLKIKV